MRWEFGVRQFEIKHGSIESIKFKRNLHQNWVLSPTVGFIYGVITRKIPVGGYSAVTTALYQ